MELNSFLYIRVIVVINGFNSKGMYGPVSYVGNVTKIEGSNILLTDAYDCTESKWEKQKGDIVINTEAVSFVSISIISNTD